MTRPYAPGFPAVAAILVAICGRPALAETSSCAPMAIAADAAVGTQWPGLVDDVREAIEAREDIDRCAKITLRSREGSVTVDVVLPDGRSAARSVSRREDVVPTLVALLVLPLPRVASPETPAQEPSQSPAPPVPASGWDERPLPPRPDPGLPRRRLRIELSVLTGGRIGDGQTSLGLGALSFLDVGGWLVGFEGRVDRYRSMQSTFDGGALELAALGGRRFRFSSASLDLTGGLAAAFQGTATFSRPSPSGQDITSESSSSTVPRLLLGGRVSFGALSMLNAFVGIDGELGPARAGTTDVPGAHRLRLWTLGLALGATVGTP